MAEVNIENFARNTMATLDRVSGDASTVHDAGKWSCLVDGALVLFLKKRDGPHLEHLEKTIDFALEFLGKEAAKWT